MTTPLRSLFLLSLTLGVALNCVGAAEDERDGKDLPPGYDPFGMNPITPTKDKKGKSNGDENLSPEERLQKARADMAKQREKFNKEQEKVQKKLAKEREKKAKDGQTDDAPFQTFNKSHKKTLELDSPDGTLTGTIPKEDNGVDANPNGVFEMKGSKSTTKSKGNTVQIGGTSEDGNRAPDLQTGTGTQKLAGEEKPEDKTEKKNFFGRLFGTKTKYPETFKAAGKGEEVKLVGQPNGSLRKGDDSESGNSPKDVHETLSHRVAAELAQERMDSESAQKKQAPPPADAKAMVVDIPNDKDAPASKDPRRAPAGFDNGTIDKPKAKPILAAIPGADADPLPQGPATDADTKAHQEYQYRAGLNSKDIYAREAAFQRAAVEHREDAIPYMLDEIIQNKAMATQVPQYLSAIGKLTPEVENVLIQSLASHDPPLRQACAEALGFLHSHKAVPVLLLSIKSDNNYNCRSAYVSALGYLGDKTAIPPLKGLLNDKFEVEIVRSRTALALARLGDPSGRVHLTNMLDSHAPAMQIMGLNGLAQIGDPELLGYLNHALESPYEEVWVTAVYLFASTGPAVAMPVLQARLSSTNEALQRRAALAMGALGSDDAVPYIDRAVRVGSLQERIMGCELLPALQRTDKAPLLIEKLQDAHTLVRQAAAVALARLKAIEALPALIEAARGPRENLALPPGLRGAAPDVNERLTIMACIRQLRGETGEVYLSTLPDKQDQSWPELDRLLSGQQVELVKMYQLIDVISDNRRAVGAVLKAPDGKELVVREGEPVAGGFRVRDIALPVAAKDKSTLPSYITLMRGDEIVRLIEGRAPEVGKVEKK